MCVARFIYHLVSYFSYHLRIGYNDCQTAVRTSSVAANGLCLARKSTCKSRQSVTFYGSSTTDVICRVSPSTQQRFASTCIL